MAEPFIGEIRNFSFGIVPRGWHPCDGSLLQIRQNQALYSLLATRYGGDGVQTFALPDLRGRAPRCAGPGVSTGTKGGSETVTLSTNELPQHAHIANAAGKVGTGFSPEGTVPAEGPASRNVFASPGASVALTPESVVPAGGAQPVQNMQPFAVTNYCIALQGIFPSRP